MFRYHPDRYRHTRPFSKQLVSQYQTLVGQEPPTDKDFREISSMIMKKYQSDIMVLPFEERPADSRFISKELSYAFHYAAFYAHGKNIFHFNPQITELFRYTNVDDVPLNMLKLPFRAIYLSFGKQNNLNLWKTGYYVDGAYIVNLREDIPIQIIVSTIRDDINYNDKQGWIRNMDKYYYAAIKNDGTFKTVGESIKDFFDKELLTLQNRKKSNEDSSGIYSINGKDYNVVDIHKVTAAKSLREVEGGIDVFNDTLRLIVNGLCYISSQEKELETRWPEDTPVEYLEKMRNSSKPRALQKARSELAALGYTKVHFCGDSYRKQNNNSSQIPRDSKNTHWRRGHWRNQAYGSGYSEHKLIWIMPVLVRGELNEPIKGHIYTVDSMTEKEKSIKHPIHK